MGRGRIKPANCILAAGLIVTALGVLGSLETGICRPELLRRGVIGPFNAIERLECADDGSWYCVGGVNSNLKYVVTSKRVLGGFVTYKLETAERACQGKGLGVIGQTSRGSIVYVNGATYGPFEETGGISFSRSGAKWGFEAEEEGRGYRVINGVFVGPFEDGRNRRENENLFRPWEDGPKLAVGERSYAFSAESPKGFGDYGVINGVSYGPYFGVPYVAVPEDGPGGAFTVTTGDKDFVIVNGRPYGPYEKIDPAWYGYAFCRNPNNTWLKLSKSGRHWGVAVNDDRAPGFGDICVIDGAPSGRYNEILYFDWAGSEETELSVFLNIIGNTHLLYTLTLDEKRIKARKAAVYTDDDRNSWAAIITPASNNGPITIVHNGTVKRPLDNYDIEGLGIADNGRSIAYTYTSEITREDELEEEINDEENYIAVPIVRQSWVVYDLVKYGPFVSRWRYHTFLPGEYRYTENRGRIHYPSNINTDITKAAKSYPQYKHVAAIPGGHYYRLRESEGGVVINGLSGERDKTTTFVIRSAPSVAGKSLALVIENLNRSYFLINGSFYGPCEIIERPANRNVFLYRDYIYSPDDVRQIFRFSDDGRAWVLRRVDYTNYFLGPTPYKVEDSKRITAILNGKEYGPYADVAIFAGPDYAGFYALEALGNGYYRVIKKVAAGEGNM